MNDDKLILITDDEPFNREVLEEILDDDYRLIFAENGKECIEQVEKHSPNLVLLDVNMPMMTGLEACNIIREKPENKNLPIIFVSALATPEQRLAGYKAGGDDYVTKPFARNILINKIELFLSSQDQALSLENGLHETHQALQTSFTSTSELYEIVMFIRESSKSSSIKALVKSIFAVLKGLDLEACLYLTNNQMLNNDASVSNYYFSDGKKSENDISLIKLHKDNERIITIDKIAIFNMPRGSLLIRNMPDDEDKRGRYRDHFAILLDGINAQVGAIYYEENLVTRRQNLIQLVDSTRFSLKKIEKLSQEIRLKHTQVLSEMGQEMENLFLNLGLTESQEIAIMELIEANELQTDALYEDGVKTDEKFNQIVEKLKVSLN